MTDATDAAADDGFADVLRAAVGQLPADERAVVTLRFGLGGPPPGARRTGLIPDAWLLAEIAERTGFAPSRVRALEESALRRIRALKHRTGETA